MHVVDLVSGPRAKVRGRYDWLPVLYGCATTRHALSLFNDSLSSRLTMISILD
jgi:hypothetical protein